MPHEDMRRRLARIDGEEMKLGHPLMSLMLGEISEIGAMKRLERINELRSERVQIIENLRGSDGAL